MSVGESDVMIEAAVPEDAPAIAELHAESFKAAYLGENQERNEKVLAEAAQFVTTSRILQRMELIQDSLVNSDEEFYHIATDENAVPIGLIYGFKTDTVQELSALYVATPYFGTGIAQDLVSVFIEWCDQTRPIELGVADDNFRAQRFYQKMGFLATNEPRESFYDFLHEIGMVLPARKDT